jgi:hypothetical protein
MQSIRVVCKVCNAEDVIDDLSTASRCFNCGNDLVPEVAEADAEPPGEKHIRCHSCGEMCDHNAMFCSTCGALLKNPLSTPKWELDPWSYLILLPILGLLAGGLLGIRMGIFALFPIVQFTVFGVIAGIFIFYVKKKKAAVEEQDRACEGLPKQIEQIGVDDRYDH